MMSCKNQDNTVMMRGPLTHLPLDKMTAIPQTASSNAFSNIVFQFKFYWSLFLAVQLTISQHYFRQWHGATQATNHCLTNVDPVRLCINASLCLRELSKDHNFNMTDILIYFDLDFIILMVLWFAHITSAVKKVACHQVAQTLLPTKNYLYRI